MDSDNHDLWNVGSFYYHCFRMHKIFELADTYIDATNEPSFNDFWKIHKSDPDIVIEKRLGRACYEQLEVSKQRSKKRSRIEEPIPNKRRRS